MGNYTPNPSMTQPIYDPTRPFATPTHTLARWSMLNSYFDSYNLGHDFSVLVNVIYEEAKLVRLTELLCIC